MNEFRSSDNPSSLSPIRVISRVQQGVNSFGTWVSNLQNVIQKHGIAVQNTLQRIAQFSAAVLEGIANVAEFLREQGEIQQAFGVTMLELGWPRPVDFPPVHKKYILDCYRQSGPATTRLMV